MNNLNNKLIGLLFTLNILDAIFTIAWIEMGVATEANPLLRPLMGATLTFMFVKIAVGMICGSLLMNKVTPWFQPIVIIGLLAYGLVVTYHLYILTLV